MQKTLAGLNEKIWTKNFLSLTLTNGLFFGGFHILLPTIPLYAAQQGGTSIQVGLLSYFYSVVY